jgi:hypothetical protein
MKKTLPVMLAVTAFFIVQACTKQGGSAPPVSVNSAQEAEAVTVNLKQPSPGDYTVKLYIENGDTSTAEFKGYVFTFKTNGILLAKVDSTTYTGKWESKNDGRELKLDIKGTPALEDAGKGWKVIRMTNTQIALQNNEGEFGNKLLFVK